MMSASAAGRDRLVPGGGPVGGPDRVSGQPFYRFGVDEVEGAGGGGDRRCPRLARRGGDQLCHVCGGAGSADDDLQVSAGHTRIPACWAKWRAALRTRPRVRTARSLAMRCTAGRHRISSGATRYALRSAFRPCS